MIYLLGEIQSNSTYLEISQETTPFSLRVWPRVKTRTVVGERGSYDHLTEKYIQNNNENRNKRTGLPRTATVAGETTSRRVLSKRTAATDTHPETVYFGDTENVHADDDDGRVAVLSLWFSDGRMSRERPR